MALQVIFLVKNTYWYNNTFTTELQNFQLLLYRTVHLMCVIPVVRVTN